MPDYYWDQNNAVPVDYLCSQWFLRPEWLQYMWVSSGLGLWKPVTSVVFTWRTHGILLGSRREYMAYCLARNC